MSTTLWTDAAMQSALKIIFDDALINSVVYDTELLDLFQDGGGIMSDQTTGGRYIETANMFALNAGVGARSENDYIPEASGPKIVNGRIYLKKLLGTVELSADTMKRVRTNEGAFVDWADRSLPALVERVNNEVDRMTLGYGAGIKARVNDATPTTDLVVDSPLGIDGLGNAAQDALLQFLAGETLIASPNADGSSPRAGTMTIQAINWNGGYLEVDALATGLADDDYLFAGDAAGNSSGGKEAMGLFGIIDDGGVLQEFQNIDRSIYPEWQSYVMDAAATFGAGQRLTEDVLTLADDESYIRGGARVDTLICSRTGLRELWQDLRSDRQINDPRSYTGGKENISMLLMDRTIEVRAPRKMPSDTAFGCTRTTMRRWVLHNWEWQDQTGSIWKQVTDATGRKDAYFCFGSMYYELGTTDPQKHFRIDNLDTAAP